MWYLIREIIWFLVLTAMLWGAVGWWLRSTAHRATLQDMESEFATKLQSLRRSRDTYRDQLEQVKVGAEHAGAQLSEQQRAKITAHIRKLEKEVNDGRAQVEALSAKLNAVASNAQARENEYKVLRQRLESASRALGERDKRIAQLTTANNAEGKAAPSDEASDAAQARQIRHYELVIAKLKARVDTLNKQSNQPLATTEHSKLLNVIQAQKKTIAGLNAKLSRVGSPPAAAVEQDDTVQRLQQQEAATAAREKELARVNNERAALAVTVERHEETIANLQQSAKAVAAERTSETRLRHALAQQQQHNSALQKELASIREEHELLTTAGRRQRQEIEELHRRLDAVPDDDAAALRAQLGERNQEVSQLQEQLSQLAQQRATPRAHERSDTSLERSGDLFDRAPAIIMSAPDGEPDNLKKIHGIGPVLERRLNELGIFHYRQIASLGDDDILWVAAQMDSFPNRIKRDDWVAQAHLLETERRAAS